jgi:replication factor C small subunit
MAVEEGVNEHTIWTEKYRPDVLENYIGNDVIKAKLEEYIQTQDIPHLLFYGTAGTGKTTAAKILVKNIDCDYMFINASDERGIDTVRDKIKGFASTVGFATLKIVVLDEADFLGREAQPALRNMMEAHAASTRFILTANYVERIIDPLVSRTQVYKLTPPSKKDVAKKLADILKNENIEYDTKTIAQIVNVYYPDIRKIINTAQLQSRDGKLQVSVDELIGQDVKLKVVDALTSNLTLKDKVTEIRKIVADAQIQDFTELYRVLFDYVEQYAPNKISQAIIAIGDGCRWDSQVIDKEINFITVLHTILTS